MTPVNADFDSATSNRKAILLMCLGVLMLVLNDTSAKWLVDRYDPFQMTFIRSVITLPMITAVILMKDGLKGLGTKRFAPHAVRGLFIMAATFCFFNALKALSLADATALFFATEMTSETVFGSNIKHSLQRAMRGSSISAKSVTIWPE